MRYFGSQLGAYAVESGVKVTCGILSCLGNPPDKPKSREVEFSEKEVLHEEIQIQ
jgi:hypothetical protein